MRRGLVGHWKRQFRNWCLGILMVTELAVPAGGATPFVPGFDRFGRHGEIDQPLAGRLLLTELSCTACHLPNNEELAAKAGPRLDGARDRIMSGWVREFLLAPQTVKPGTTMPDVLAGVPANQRPGVVDALVAFLLTQQEPFPEVKAGGADPVPHEFWNKGNPVRGRELYHQVGCVACHEADSEYETVETKPSPLDELLQQLDAEELAEMGLTSAVRPVNSVPHADLPRKYSRRSLTFFLLDPQSTRRGGRMPSLKLAAMDAAHIAAWLLRDQAESAVSEPVPPESLVDQGRRMFAELRCANCHSAADVKSHAAKQLSQLEPSNEVPCWGPPSNGRPHYALDAAQVEVIKVALGSKTAIRGVNPAADAHFRMLQLNCYACHERNDIGGVGRNRRPYFETAGHIDVGDEGRIPPPLSGVGRKLLTPWIKQVLSGAGDVRPYMQARMPQFPSPLVAALPGQLAAADQSGAADSGPALKEIKGLESAGRALMDVGCVQCHPFRGDALPGVVGIDLMGVTGRLHLKWFREFLLSPSELKPRTRMPAFFPGGQSQHPDILDGDPRRQIAAMWAYLKGGENQPLPGKIEAARNQDFELIPTERALVVRTFMPAAGTHAIAVGSPSGVHFAFDADLAWLAQAWKGRFLDAQGTWFSRFAPPAEPLGEGVMALPPGPLFAILADELAPWPDQSQRPRGSRFDGYRLDATGVPTFLYHLGSWSVEDRIEPGEDITLKRHLALTPRPGDAQASRLYVRPHVGQSLKRTGDRTYVNENGLTVSVTVEHAGRLRRTESGVEWVLPLDLQADETLEVRYSW